MCSIVGSFSKQTFKELVTLNQSRGLFSYSFMVFDPTNHKIVSLKQNFGEFPLSIVDEAQSDMYYIGHTQAPTSGLIRDVNRIHPAMSNNQFLFHNGIIKQKDVMRLKSTLGVYEEWDSKLMLLDIQNTSLIETVNTIDGSFACVYFDGTDLMIFRSAAGTLFIDEKMNISSTKFNDSYRIDKDKVYALDFKNELREVCAFTSKSSPYFIS
jgi:glutamine phosphoribosylpyrophosphate amidotransferase